MADARLGISVSADAKQASATFKALSDDIKEVGKQSVGVTEQFNRTQTAIEKLAKAPDTPRALGQAIAKAKLELEDLQRALDRTPASAERMKALTAAMLQAESAIGKASARASRLQDAMEETTLSIEKGKDSVASFGAALSSPAAMFDKMRDSASGFDQAIGKLGGSLIVAQQGFELAEKGGRALAKAIDECDAKRAAYDKGMADAAVNTIKFESAMRLAQRGVIGLGGSQAEFLKRYDEYIAKTNPATRATDAQTEALKRQKTAWDDLGKTMEMAGKGVEFKLTSPEEAFGDAGKYADKLNDILKKAFETGGEAERDAWAKANEDTLNRVAAAYEKWGRALPEHVRAAYEAMKGASVDWIAQLEAENAAAEQTYQAKMSRWAAEDAAANRTSRAPEQYKAIQDAAFGAAVANGELGTNLDRVAEAVVKTGGTMTVGAPIWIQIAQATDEATAALLRFAKASRALNEEQAKSLEVTRGWTDYVIALKDSYDAGTTSLYNYVTELQKFKTQLLQMFGAATGEAKEALESMIALIEKLIATAGAGGSNKYDPSMAGQLEKAFRDAKGNG